jgi:hypothetical protein
MTKAILAAAIIAALAAATPYQCNTDTECEAEQALRCFILCQ